jgi:hypothetical protein
LQHRGISQVSDFVQSKTLQSLQDIKPILETPNEGVVIADNLIRFFLSTRFFEEMTGFPRS